jgi:hypothetical protein
MSDQAAAAGPFAAAARLLEDLAGAHLTVKRVERAAEASGAAQAAAARGRSAMITTRKPLPLPPLPDKLYAAIDSTGVPVTSKELVSRYGLRWSRALLSLVGLILSAALVLQHAGFPGPVPGYRYCALYAAGSVLSLSLASGHLPAC